MTSSGEFGSTRQSEITTASAPIIEVEIFFGLPKQRHDLSLGRHDPRENLMVSRLQVFATVDGHAHSFGLLGIASSFVDARLVAAQALEQIDLGIFLGLDRLELFDAVPDQPVSAAQDRVLAFEDVADRLTKSFEFFETLGCAGFHGLAEISELLFQLAEFLGEAVFIDRKTPFGDFAANGVDARLIEFLVVG